MFACIHVIVGFKSLMQLMLFVKCIYVPTLNKSYFTLLYLSVDPIFQSLWFLSW